MAVAVNVFSGTADVGLGIMAAAKALGLDFMPLLPERTTWWCRRPPLPTAVSRPCWKYPLREFQEAEPPWAAMI